MGKIPKAVDTWLIYYRKHERTRGGRSTTYSIIPGVGGKTGERLYVQARDSTPLETQLETQITRAPLRSSHQLRSSTPQFTRHERDTRCVVATVTAQKHKRIDAVLTGST